LGRSAFCSHSFRKGLYPQNSLKLSFKSLPPTIKALFPIENELDEYLALAGSGATVSQVLDSGL
jgi:hypothetical protein